MQNTLLLNTLAGFVGGLVRGLVGIRKSQEKMGDKFVFNWSYFLFPLLVSTLVGILSGLLISEGDWKLALMAGYAGPDFLENLYKLKLAPFLSSKA